MTFTVSLDRAPEEGVTVAYATADHTALAGNDYTSRSGTLTFAAGVMTQTIAVPILEDDYAENTQTFMLNLSGPINAVFDDSQGVGSILDNESTPCLSITNASAVETAGVIAFPVAVSIPRDEAITVNYATEDVTASV